MTHMIKPFPFVAILLISLSSVLKVVLGTEMLDPVLNLEDISASTDDFVDVQPFSPDLPIPPLSVKQDVKAKTPILGRRSALKGYFEDPRKPQNMESNFTIPPIMKHHWLALNNELEWFPQPIQKETLSKLFDIMFEDDYSKYLEFEKYFQQVFSVGYSSFYLNSRTVLTWLISFGAVNILSSIKDLSSYTIDTKTFEFSLEHLVKTHKYHHLASMINLVPFLSMPILPVKKNLFVIISQKRKVLFEDNIALLFLEMKQIDSVHIGYITAIVETGTKDDAQIFVLFCSSIRNFISKYDKSQVHKFLNALNDFFIEQSWDYNNITNQTALLFLAHLFIDFNNWIELDKIISNNQKFLFNDSSDPNILLTAMETGNIFISSQIVEKYPNAITSFSKFHNSPLFHAIISKQTGFFEMFLPYIDDINKAVPFYDKFGFFEIKPVGIAIIYSNLEMLKFIISTTKSRGIDFNLPETLEDVFNYEEECLSRCNPPKRKNNFISDEMWEYLLNENIESHFVVEAPQKILNMAVRDKSVHAVRILLDRFESSVSKEECYNLLNNDMDMLKFFLSRGLNVNASIGEQNYNDEIQNVPVLVFFLQRITEDQLQEELFALPGITDDIIQAAKTYALSKHLKSVYKSINVFNKRAIDSV